MGGNTGNIRGRRNQSSSNGYKTLGSILSSDSGNGAGSFRRIYTYYVKRSGGVISPFKSIFNINRGQFADRAQYFIGNIA